MESFGTKWQKQMQQGKHVCIGLDPVAGNFLNQGLLGDEDALKFSDFCVRIVDATADLAAAFKPNFAFFEACGVQGLESLFAVCNHIRENFPDVILVLDFKRGDIGPTNFGSAQLAFDDCQADAVTVQPYLGAEAMKPFLSRTDKGIFVLGKTSNPGSGEFQNLRVALSDAEELEIFGQQLPFNHIGNQRQFFEVVAARVARFWNANGNCGLVAGATYPEELEMIRQIAPELPLLIPGVGKQGGDVFASVKAARHQFIINSSSAIIYASKNADFAEAARAKTIELDNQIRDALHQAA